MTTRRIAKSCSQVLSRPSPATQAFLRISGRRQFHDTPPLDFLVPSIPTALFKPITPARRSFGTSPSRWGTVVVTNPRQDDDGKEMVVEITPRASNRLKEIMMKDSNPNLALRISVESGGCHGFQYLMSLTTLPPQSNSSSNDIAEETPPALNTSSADPNAMPPQEPGSPAMSPPSSANASSSSEGSTDATEIPDEEDTIFTTDDGSGAKIVMDGPSLELLKGSKVDFTMELIGSQFKIVDNPLATSSCGCGTSFDIKS